MGSVRVPWRTWLLWCVCLVGATLAMLLLRERLDKAHVALVYLLVVLGASAAGGRAVGLTIAAAAFLGFNYLFLPPYYTLVIADPLDWLVLVTFAITGIVAAQLLYRARATTELAMARAQEVDRLATLGAESLAAPSAGAALHAIAEVIRSTLDARHVSLYRREINGFLRRTTQSGTGRGRGDDEVLMWYGDRVRVAITFADGTTRLDPASLVDVELLTIDRMLEVRDQTVGMLHVEFADRTSLSVARARLLDALSYYAALGVERVRLEATAERAEAERRMESLRSALLMAVSHDLRTPLTTIKALAHEIDVSSSSNAPVNAVRIIEQEADRLDALVGDLLDLSRLQAGAMSPTIAVNTVDELIGASLQRAHGALAARAVAVSLPDEMLIASFDLSQSVRILTNLLENAAKYAPADTSIEVTARRDGDMVLIDVADEGPGVPAGESERIFEPFYRPTGTPPDVRGTGLGLSIARGLAEAQHGWLRYRDRVGGGSLFTLALPAASGPSA